MRVVDTSVWIEWLAGTALGREIAVNLPPREHWIVPTIVQFELCKWLRRTVDEDRNDDVIAFSHTCRLVDLDSHIALFAADLSARYKLATADSIVYATARLFGADLLTCDRHFAGLDNVVYLEKPPDR